MGICIGGIAITRPYQADTGATQAQAPARRCLGRIQWKRHQGKQAQSPDDKRSDEPEPEVSCLVNIFTCEFQVNTFNSFGNAQDMLELR